MILEQQRFWIDLVNARDSWDGPEACLGSAPEGSRDFSDPPGWSRQKAFNYLVNNVELLRANHRSLEDGKPLDYDMINLVLSEGVLRLTDWGGVEDLRRAREERGRLETLVTLSRRDGLNSGSAYVRDTVERAFFYFAQYVDYRFDDPTYPGAEAERIQVRECLRERCRLLFIRSPVSPLYCSNECARADA